MYFQNGIQLAYFSPQILAFIIAIYLNKYRYHMEQEPILFQGLNEEQSRKLQLIFGKDYNFRKDFPNIRRLTGLVKAVLSKLPSSVLEGFQDWLRENQGKLKDLVVHAQTTPPKDYNTQFENWGETVSATYSNIYYPTIELTNADGEPIKPEELNIIRTQIADLQAYVKKNFDEGKKRIRGSGIRHSWASIFADPEQLLVSFYPYNVAIGTSFKLESWAVQMQQVEKELIKEKVQHLNMLRKIDTKVINGVKKTLVKIGAGVSNEQMRLWCLENKLQYKSNVIMVEVNVCGALGTCSHGAGIETQTIPDYVNAIEFIDHKGDRQVISKDKNPELIMSAASNLGLLGLTIFVTLELEDLQVVRFLPYQTYKDFVIPWPSDYSEGQIQTRRSKQEYLNWKGENNSDPSWQDSFKRFKNAIFNTYCEWFYFPIEKVNVFENNWHIYKKRSELGLTDIQVQSNIRKDKENGHPEGEFIGDYPRPIIKKIGELSLYIGDKFINSERWGENAVNIFMKNPFLFFPSENVWVNYPDAVHFQRGIQNMKVRDIEFEINVPDINGEIDYNLIQKIWWVALEYVEGHDQDINIALEMRLFKGSNATLAPEIGYGTVCSIEILRSMPLNADQEDTWKQHCLNIFRFWRDLRDSNGNAVLIRPHWGKEWSDIAEVKEHVYHDEDLKTRFRTFLDEYDRIAAECKIDATENLRTFSNTLYREMFNNALEGTNRPPLQ